MSPVSAKDDSDSLTPSQLPGGVRKPTWKALFFGLIPFIAICFAVPLWDRVQPTVAGLPFNLFWLIAWMLLTPVCTWCAYRCEARAATQPNRATKSEPE